METGGGGSYVSQPAGGVSESVREVYLLGEVQFCWGKEEVKLTSASPVAVRM